MEVIAASSSQLPETEENSCWNGGGNRAIQLPAGIRFGVRELAPAMECGGLPPLFLGGSLLPLLFRWRLAAAKVVPFRTVASRCVAQARNVRTPKGRTE